MKPTIVSLAISMLALMTFTACGPATPTPVSSGPLGVAPTATPTAAPVLVQAPLGVKPACTPPDLTIKVNSFCANPGAGLGGATVEDPNGAGYFLSVPGNWDCTGADPKTICSGPPDSQALYLACSSCAAPDVGAAGDFECQKGLIKKNGNCLMDPNADWITCTYTSHWDNAQQTCVDNTSGNPIPPTDLCPAGYPYYDAAGYCFAQPVLWKADNCQYYPVTLGECSLQQNKPATGGGTKSCPAGTNWNGSCCENSDHRCQ